MFHRESLAGFTAAKILTAYHFFSFVFFPSPFHHQFIRSSIFKYDRSSLNRLCVHSSSCLIGTSFFPSVTFLICCTTAFISFVFFSFCVTFKSHFVLVTFSQKENLCLVNYYISALHRSPFSVLEIYKKDVDTIS